MILGWNVECLHPFIATTSLQIVALFLKQCILTCRFEKQPFTLQLLRASNTIAQTALSNVMEESALLP